MDFLSNIIFILLQKRTNQFSFVFQDVKHWYQVIKMIYFKSFVSVLFRLKE